MTRPKFTVAEVIARIGIPTERWKGNCYGIALEMVDVKLVPNGTAVYGHWLGPIHEESFFALRRGHGFCQHGWIITPDGTVIDPTRWVFEAVEPYIFVGHEDDLDPKCPDFEPADDAPDICEHCGCAIDDHPPGFFRPCLACGPTWPYDEGGNMLRRMRLHPPPKADKNARRFPVLAVGHQMPNSAILHLQGLTGDRDGLFGYARDQAFWIANLPLELLAPYASEIYAWLRFHKIDGFIPIDNERKVARDDATRNIRRVRPARRASPRRRVSRRPGD